jgi:hypothetical protein
LETKFEIIRLKRSLVWWLVCKKSKKIMDQEKKIGYEQLGKLAKYLSW